MGLYYVFVPLMIIGIIGVIWSGYALYESAKKNHWVIE